MPKFHVDWHFLKPVPNARWRFAFALASFLISFFLRDVLNPGCLLTVTSCSSFLQSF